MSKHATQFQKAFMSRMYRGKGIFKPLNTGWIDERVACVREWIANIFFYTKDGTTIMIDAGYNYDRLKEKMGWLDIDPAGIRHILLTHQDTDHVGAVEADSDLLFRDAALYLSRIENRYLTGETRRRVLYGLYSLPPVKTENRKALLEDGQVLDLDGIKVECLLVPGHTWGHMVYLIDDAYLFTGDTIWLGSDGGYSFISALAEDNELAKQSLRRLEQTLRDRELSPRIITGHTGWTDSLDFAFAHKDQVCHSTKKQTPYDPKAPFDGYEEADDTEENARNVLIAKQDETIFQNGAPDYGNWMPKSMIAGAAAGAAALGAAGIAACKKSAETGSAAGKILGAGLLLGAAGAGAFSVYGFAARKAFSYEGKKQISRRIIEGTARYVRLPDGGAGLDIGCGNGALTIACAKQNLNAKMVGCDIWSGVYKNVFSQKICENNARAEGVSNVRFEPGNAIKLPYEDETFDAVTSNYVYHNIAGHDKQDLLLETLRVLKKGGVFAIHDLMSKAHYGDMEGFIRKLKGMGFEDVRLIDTTDGTIMDRGEAVLLGLGCSKLLTGRK